MVTGSPAWSARSRSAAAAAWFARLSSPTTRAPSHGSKQAMSLMLPTGVATQRGRTRSPVCMAAGHPASTACSMAVSAPSSRISAQPNGRASGCPSRGSGIQVQLTTVPSGPTSSSVPGDSPVPGSYSNGGACTRPSAARVPRIRRPASAVMNWLSTGPSERV